MSEQLSMNMDANTIATHRDLAQMFYNGFCAAILHANKGYDTNVIKLEERIPQSADAYSAISIQGRTLFRIYGKRTLNIAVNPSLESLFLKYGITFKESKAKQNSGTWKRLNTGAYQCFTTAPSLAAEVLEEFLCQDGFGCCSRYEACSTARHCVHPDVMFAARCAYRRNLLAGKIFYGENKNA